MVHLLDEYNHYVPVEPLSEDILRQIDPVRRSLYGAEVSFRKLESLFFDKNIEIDQCRGLTLKHIGQHCLITFDAAACVDLTLHGATVMETAKNLVRALQEHRVLHLADGGQELGVCYASWNIQEVHVERINNVFVRGALSQEEAKRLCLYRIERPLLKARLPLETAADTLTQVYDQEVADRRECCMNHIKNVSDIITRTLESLDEIPQELCGELAKFALKTIGGTLLQQYAPTVTPSPH